MTNHRRCAYYDTIVIGSGQAGKRRSVRLLAAAGMRTELVNASMSAPHLHQRRSTPTKRQMSRAPRLRTSRAVAPRIWRSHRPIRVEHASSPAERQTGLWILFLHSRRRANDRVQRAKNLDLLPSAPRGNSLGRVPSPLATKTLTTRVV